MKRDAALVVGIFLVALAVANPRGNMPLDDDWDFALATWHFAGTGHFVVTPFTAVSLFAQAAWGAAWTKALGESFEVLRASTIVLGAAALVAFLFVLRGAGVPRGARIIAALALAFHPIFFWSSATYMTHVPFVCMAIAAFAANLRGLRENDLRWMGVGALAVVASFLIRQTGIANVLPPLALLLLQRERVTPRWRTFVVVAGLPLVAFATLLPWLLRAETLGHARLSGSLATNVVDNLIYGALFALPLVVASLSARGRAFWIALAAVGVRVALAAWPPPWRPWSLLLSSDASSGNVLTNLGLGPWTTMDVRELAMEPPVAAGVALRLALTLLGVIVAAGAVALVASRMQSPDLASRLAVAQVIASTAVLGVSGMYFDRYALDSLWALLLLGAVAIGGRPRSVVLAGVLLTVVAVAVTAGVHDYFAWNRARFALWQSLRIRGVAVESINAGYELNAWGRLSGRPLPSTRPAWLIRNDYVIAFHRLPGYEVVDHQTIEPLVGRARDIFSERRLAAAAKGVPPTSVWR